MIAGEAAHWTVETGGDLFGLWEPTPTIYFASRAGPNAVREVAHFRLDVEYLRELSDLFAAEWSIRYLGDWHSHHRLGLREPSPGDRQRIQRVAGRNGFEGMAEIIVTLQDEREDRPDVCFHPWVYALDEEQPGPSELVILPGLSPVREALALRASLPEQELLPASEAALSCIGLADSTADQIETEAEQLVDAMARELISQARRALESEAGEFVEEYPSPFGVVLAVPIDSDQLVGLAIGGKWPREILAVHWIDRGCHRSEALDVNRPPNLLVPTEVVSLYREVRKLKEVEVD